MEQYLLISEAAKEVMVESHVLRYWEEELHLPIKRNEMGHRYYTQDDIVRFKKIKNMKERGLQLKAIKMILRDGRLDMLPQSGKGEYREPEKEGEEKLEEFDRQPEMKTVNADIENESRIKTEDENPFASAKHELGTGRETESVYTAARYKPELEAESREEKAQRLQWILQQLIRQAVQENNRELVREIKDSVLKELDYQFRMQEEREEERARIEAERTENYYQRMDELLRQKSRGRGSRIQKETGGNHKKLTLVLDESGSQERKKGSSGAGGRELRKGEESNGKKKRHFLF